MDFKVCSTTKGITRRRWTIKATGLTQRDSAQRTSSGSRRAVCSFLNKMLEQIPAPRTETKETAPQIISFYPNR